MMQASSAKPLTGRKVFAIIGSAFAVIIAVNLTLAYQAIATFPGLEVRNSYVASQTFDVDRTAQLALGWDVSAQVQDGILRLSVTKNGNPVAAEIVSATLGRPTNVSQDETPAFQFDGQVYAAPVTVGPGNWDMWLKMRAADGTIFQQRMAVSVRK